MSLLNPRNLISNPEPPAAGIERALQSIGLSTTGSLKKSVLSILEENGCTIEEAVEQMAFIMRTTTSDAMKMRAIENIFKLSGANAQAAVETNTTVNNIVIYAPQVKMEEDFEVVDI